MAVIKQPLTNAQLELLKVFTHNLSEQDLKELKIVLGKFFANRLVEKRIKHGMKKAGRKEIHSAC